MTSEDSARPPAGLPEVRKITDARTLRALAHPVRVELLEALLHGGAQTATEAGERIGETPTTCSFHLRQLASYGFVEEAGGGSGRSRPWRLTTIGMSFAPASGDRAAEVASEAVMRLFRERQLARYDAWRATQASYPPEWRDAATDSEYVFYLTPAELRQMNTEVHKVLGRWLAMEGRLKDPARRPPGSARWRRCCSATRSRCRASPPARPPGAAADGAILAGFAAGALIGTLTAGQFGQPRRPAVTGSAAFLAESAAIAFLGSVALVVAAQAVLGACSGSGNTFTITAFQRRAAASAG